MALFDRYIAVDWSAHNGPKRGADSIWIGEWGPSGSVPSRNLPTRAAAMADLEQTLLSARARGERILLGFDFAFGFPSGTASALAPASPPPPPLRGRVPEGRVRGDEPQTSPTLPLAGRAGEGGDAPQPWQSLWSLLSTLVEDTDQNLSNRFEVAEHLNRLGARFWGHPHGRTYTHLTPKKPLAAHGLPERRAVEAHLSGPQPVWKLTGVGAVGSQTLLGIPRLEALRRHPVLGPDIAVWPFETDFERRLDRPILLAEIYPSLFAPMPGIVPRDRAQVETCVTRYAGFDVAGELATFLAAPAGLDPARRAIALSEEGWIAGVGQSALSQPAGAAA